MKTRKELKFLCDDRELTQIENRIKAVMHKDPHQKGDCYQIRSIYFDSPTDKCFYENQAGVGTRTKYRLRIYDQSDSVIKAEVKSKYFDTTHKISTRISREQFEGLMKGTAPDLLESEAFKRFCVAVIGEGYRPKSIVEYERSAYLYEPCNVRVTFDRNIAVGTDYNLFFDKDLPVRPICETGWHVLEVKYDEFLPDYILSLLKAGNMRRTSFSKYYESRLRLL